MRDFFERYAGRIAIGMFNECWLWTGARITAGYGHGHRDRQHFYAHRAAYESRHGRGAANGLIVRHRCDNPPCCNPDHLEIGTVADNCRDAVERGRINPARGERAPTAKMTEAQVVEARNLARAGVPIADLVRRFDLKHTAMTALVTGATWTHLAGAVSAPSKALPPGSLPGQNAKLLSAEKVAAIKRRIRAGHGNRPIAADYGVKHGTISAIRTGRIWSHVT